MAFFTDLENNPKTHIRAQKKLEEELTGPDPQLSIGSESTGGY